MLKNIEHLIHLLKDPASGSSLEKSNDHFVFIKTDTKVPLVDGKLALIDPERTIIDLHDATKDNGASKVDRKTSALRNWIKNALWKSRATTIAKKNCQQFVDELKSAHETPIVLIIGGGERGIGTELLYDDPDIQLVSFDVYSSPNNQLVADAHDIPLKDGSVDGIWIQYVIEHVIDPFRVSSEIYRVLSSRGILYSETPFMQQVHEAAFDFLRFSHSGHRWLFRSFEEISSGIAMGSGIQLLWTIEHITRTLFRSKKCGKIAKLLFFWVRFLDHLGNKNMMMDSSSSFYFLGKKSDRKLSMHEIIAYYRESRS